MRTVDVQKVHVHKHSGAHDWTAALPDVRLPGFDGFRCRRCCGTAWMLSKGKDSEPPPEFGCYDVLPMADRYVHPDYSI